MKNIKLDLKSVEKREASRISPMTKAETGKKEGGGRGVVGEGKDRGEEG